MSEISTDVNDRNSRDFIILCGSFISRESYTTNPKARHSADKMVLLLVENGGPDSREFGKSVRKTLDQWLEDYENEKV